MKAAGKAAAAATLACGGCGTDAILAAASAAAAAARFFSLGNSAAIEAAAASAATEAEAAAPEVSKDLKLNFYMPRETVYFQQVPPPRPSSKRAQSAPPAHTEDRGRRALTH